MSVIAAVSVPVEDFPLGRALEETPDVRVELDRIVPTGDAVLPFFWAWGEDVDSLVTTLAEDASVEEVAVPDRVDGGALVRATWTAAPGLVAGIAESGVTLLEAYRWEEFWRLRLRSPDHESVVALQRYCADHDVDLRLEWIHTLAAIEAGEQYGLTDDQRRTVVAAFERGYFDDPRGITIEELAAGADVSPRAVSKRLRRGLRNLVDATLAVEE
ncbi:helix-turn-helix domain-containing protein [Halorussus halobius]|uniref:helix-turn-helix domain-containing protein n=1 Tax=Halorussus halobius TaxID=1710537 RepID=UPI0010919CDD|nr:helix-turn-helix domain-containing protein [Halorussus halobius]